MHAGTAQIRPMATIKATATDLSTHLTAFATRCRCRRVNCYRNCVTSGCLDGVSRLLKRLGRYNVVNVWEHIQLKGPFDAQNKTITREDGLESGLNL